MRCLATAGTPEELYGRRKMTHHLRRAGHQVAFCTVDRTHGVSWACNGIRRGKAVRTTIPGKDARPRRVTCSTASSELKHPTGSGWPTSLICEPGPGSATSPSSSTCSPNASWPGTRPPTSAPIWCSLRCGSRCGTGDRGGHPVQPGQLVHHNDAGSQYTSIRFTEHLALEGDRTLDRDGRRRLRQRPHGNASSVCSRPNASAPMIFHTGPLQDPRRRGICHRRLGRLVQPPPAARLRWAWSHRRSSSTPTTLPSHRRVAARMRAAEKS